MRLPIRIRITAWHVALLAAVLVALGAFVALRLRADLIAATDATLEPAAAQIADDYREEGVPELYDSARTVLHGERVAAQVLDDGHVVAWWGDPVARTPLLPAGTVTRSGQDFRVAGHPVVRDGRSQTVVAAESLAPVQRAVSRVVVLLLLAGPAALLAVAAGGWWLARRALRPIARITTTAERIGVERLGERVAVPSAADEVGHLARTLNTMLDRIERGVHEQHRLVADASHELRTPLAAMRSELDVSLRADALTPEARAVLESTREEVDRLSRTVDDLLTLASADEGRLDLAFAPLDLRDVAADAMTAVAPLARRRGVQLHLDGEPAAARGDAARLGHAVRNLLENAVEFSPPGGRVDVTTWTRNGEVGATVRDDGPGVPAQLRERVFDRFYRIDPSRTRATGGSGLGLAIAREIAAAHDGRAWLEDRSDFSIALPRVS